MLAAAAAGALAQNGDTIPGTTKRPFPAVQEVPTDPRVAQEGQLPLTVAVRPAAAMTQEDKDLAASAAGAIRERAALYELGFNQGDWQESQLECPAFPQHLFLRFTRNMGTGDLSMFTVSIPRGREGRVRVIPILRRGFAPIFSAPESKTTMAAFNQVRAEEHIGAKADWSAVSVCYAAMTSARWNQPHDAVTLVMVGSPTLVLGDHGVLSVALELADPAPGRWVVLYDRSGQVVKTEYTGFRDLTWRPVPAPVADLKGKPFPPVYTEENGRPVPVGSEPQGKPLPAPTSGDNQGKPQ